MLEGALVFPWNLHINLLPVCKETNIEFLYIANQPQLIALNLCNLWLNVCDICSLATEIISSYIGANGLWTKEKHLVTIL